jgi:pyruvate/2-oxoglutarate dehydrogenase complex dihydrolipoamide dehydrogenase (E3) component
MSACAGAAGPKLRAQTALEADGCPIRLNVETRRVEAIDSGVRVHCSDETLDGSHLFLATGRQPNTDGLGLETVDVRLDEQVTL